MGIRRGLHNLNRVWLQYEYKHTTLALTFVILFIILFDSTLVSTLLAWVRNMGYVGVFITGMLSVSFFTLVPSVVLLVEMAPHYDPFAMAVVAGAGAMVGDWAIMFFFREKVFEELTPLLRHFHIPRLARLMKHKYASWVFFVFGAIVVATPLPDELGLALLGISHFRASYVLAICFVLNALGIFGIIMAARALPG